MQNPTYQTQFDALILALQNQEWAKGYLFLIELKNMLESNQPPFHAFNIREDQAEFLEQEFSFSEEELTSGDDITRAIEAFLEDQAG